MPMDLICPYRYSSPPTSADATDLAHIAECFNEIAAQTDVMLVESAGMLDFADLAAMLDLEVIVSGRKSPRMRRSGRVHDPTLRAPRTKARRLHSLRLRSNSSGQRRVTPTHQSPLSRPNAPSRAPGPHNRRKAHLNSEGELAGLQLEARNPHLPAAAPAGLLSRQITGDVIPTQASPSRT